MKLYKTLFTPVEFLEDFGYDLHSMVVQGGFKTKELAVQSWCDEAALSINNLIVRNRGLEFSRNIYTVDNAEILNTLKWAQLYEMLFIVENGNIQLSAEVKQELKLHSADAINLLYANGILINGF